MLRKIIFVGAASMIAVSAHAITASDITESVRLKDGTTVHVFKDGKMGMENRYGRAFQMPEGHVMQIADGRTITMVGNEVARVAVLNAIEP